MQKGNAGPCIGWGVNLPFPQAHGLWHLKEMQPLPRTHLVPGSGRPEFPEKPSVVMLPAWGGDSCHLVLAGAPRGVHPTFASRTLCKPEAEDRGTHKPPHQGTLAASPVEGDRGPGQGGWGLNGLELFPGSRTVCEPRLKAPPPPACSNQTSLRKHSSYLIKREYAN